MNDMPNPQTIFLIAADFWKTEKGRTDAEIEAVLKSGDEKLMKKFLEPGVNIYRQLKDHFNGLKPIK